MRKVLKCVLCVLTGAAVITGCAAPAEKETAAVHDKASEPTAVPKKEPVYYYTFPDVLGMEAAEAVSLVKEIGFKNVILNGDNGTAITNSTDFYVTKQNYQENDSVESDAQIVLTCAMKQYMLYVEVDFHENWFLNRYDIDFYLDDLYVDTLSHGNQYTNLIEAYVGEHTIRFEKHDDPDISYSYGLDLQENSTYSCNISSHGSSLEISNVYYVPGVELARIEMPDVTGMNLSDAVDTLENCQFSNISFESDNGWPIWVQSNWTVVSQNQDPGLHIDKNEEIKLVCKRSR